MLHLSVVLAVIGGSFLALCTQTRPHLAQVIFHGRSGTVFLHSPFIWTIQNEFGISSVF